MKVPITQSQMWHNLQKDLGEESFLEQGSGYQYLAILKKTPAGNYLYLPYGPVAKDRKGFENAIKTLKLLAKRTESIFIRVEPLDPSFTQYFPQNTKKSTDLNPKETWLLDLKGDEVELKSKLPSRLLRYYKSAEKKGITITESHDSDDIHYLLDLQKSLAKQKGINTFSEEYLKTELSQPFATLYLVKHQQQLSEAVLREYFASPSRSRGDESSRVPDSPKRRPDSSTRVLPGAQQTAQAAQPQIIAAGLVFDDKDTRYNLQGAQSDEGRKLHATGILTIKLILDAYEKGLKTFDFWGIAPENAPKNHPWTGFTNFKKTFAGYQVDHAGTYDIVLNPRKYRHYQIMRKINRLLHK